MKKIHLVLLTILIQTISFAQTKEIKGKVVDENKAPVANANVSTKSSASKTQTGTDGTFILKVPNSPTKVSLVITNVAFNDATAVWNGNDNMIIGLTKKTAV
jgi:hypothetical protein